MVSLQPCREQRRLSLPRPGASDLTSTSLRPHQSTGACGLDDAGRASSAVGRVANRTAKAGRAAAARYAPVPDAPRRAPEPADRQVAPVTSRVAGRRIAIFDHAVTDQSPAGSCHLRLLENLSGELDFTVFATEFHNPDPRRIRWVRIPALRRPLPVRY